MATRGNAAARKQQDVQSMARRTRKQPERPRVDDQPAEDLIESDEPRPAGDPIGDAAGLDDDPPDRSPG